MEWIEDRSTASDRCLLIGSTSPLPESFQSGKFKRFGGSL